LSTFKNLPKLAEALVSSTRMYTSTLDSIVFITVFVTTLYKRAPILQEAEPQQ
jgi:hypothetical protein